VSGGSPPHRDVIIETLVEAARASAAIANYCDHAEHNEPVDGRWIIDAGARFRQLAWTLAEAAGLDIFAVYATRLGAIEAKHVLASISDFDGAEAARTAATWSELQGVQATHDRIYHPDVFGLSRAEQLRHYAFHAAKIVGSLATLTVDATQWADFTERRLPDMLLFGIKLATVVAEPLSEDPLRS
jgi:hypothetical protein